MQIQKAFSQERSQHPGRLRLGLVLLGIALLAVAMRILHLFADGYYLMSADSHFFNWRAEMIMDGGGQTGVVKSGLTYPLVYAANTLEALFGLSPDAALRAANTALPLLLGVLGGMVVYIGVAQISSRRVALVAALVWAVLADAVFVTSAGYIDRDGLSVLLMSTALFLFYVSRQWHIRLGSRDLGWLAGGLAVLAVEALLYLEWRFSGLILLLPVMLLYFVVAFLVDYTARLNVESSVWRRVRAALAGTNWPVLAVVMGVNAVAAIGIALAFPHWGSALVDKELAVVGGETGVAEQQGLGPVHVIGGYGFFLIPLAVGLYVGFKTRAGSIIFFACWFLAVFGMALYARRIFFFAAPAAAVLVAVGLIYLWGLPVSGRGVGRLKKAAVVALVTTAIALSASLSFSIGNSPTLAADEYWQDALAYIRENTPEDAIVMTQWSWGYWILDLAERESVVNNGRYDDASLYAVGLAYSTEDAAEAAQAMGKYGADYLIFGENDRRYAPTIIKWGGLEEEYEDYDGFPPTTLYSRAMSGRFEGEGGLKVVYRNPEVVVLQLTNESVSGQPLAADKAGGDELFDDTGRRIASDTERST